MDIVHRVAGRVLADPGLVGVEKAVQNFLALLDRAILRQSGRKRGLGPGAERWNIFAREPLGVAVIPVIQFIWAWDDPCLHMLQPQARPMDRVAFLDQG